MIIRTLLVLALAGIASPNVRAAGAPFNIVYGWFPSWISSSATSGLDASQLTHLAWFSCEVDTATGSLLGLPLWQSTPVVTWAQNNGVRVHLTITCFGDPENRALLNSPTRRSRCISEIVSALRLRNADGVNLDFEAVGGSERANLVLFVQELRDSLPSKEITMATPPVDWSNAFDLAALSRVCDFLLLMGYDYYWSGSSTAGPVAPLAGENYNVGRSVTTYLAAGVDPLRLVLAVPLYARRWNVVGPARKAAAIDGAESLAYRYSSLATLPGADARLFDEATGTSWFNTMENGLYYQTWWDDSTSLVRKYRFIQQRQLRGVGYWALGYDGGLPSMWNGLRSIGVPNSVDAEPLAISDDEEVSIFDMGGRQLATMSKGAIKTSSLRQGVYVIVSQNGKQEKVLR